ncbi:hypothetical protein BDZ89DRAFT_1163771 [Hymenopellis radicata]|nr:hypothetical protein BDZ89DRAFT_1163771 [Hymenopellis radicata]
MPTTIVLPDGCWPLLASNLLLSTQAVMVLNRRKIAKIEYPQMYAEKAEVEKSPDALNFNSMQRVHGNTLENIKMLTVCTILTALHYPIFAAITSGCWVVGRILYTQGYLQAPDIRNKRGGFLSQIAFFALQAGAIVSVAQLLGSKFW